jgi:hypothetical protein
MTTAAKLPNKSGGRLERIPSEWNEIGAGNAVAIDGAMHQTTF